VGTQLVTEAEQLLGDAVALRRAIHANPEVGLDLPATQQAVLSSLDGLGLELYTCLLYTSRCV